MKNYDEIIKTANKAKTICDPLIAKIATKFNKTLEDVFRDICNSRGVIYLTDVSAILKI